MGLPSNDDYVEAYSTLFEKFEQGRDQPSRRGRPYEYEERILSVYFTMMMIIRAYNKKVSEISSRQAFLHSSKRLQTRQ